MEESLRHSFIILKRISNQLKNVEESIQYVVDKKLEVFNSTNNYQEIFHLNTLLYSLIYYSLINYSSFVDEYNDFFISKKTTERDHILTIKKKCKKYFTEVKKEFGNIKKHRNNLLAHGYRDGKAPLTDEQINHGYNQLILAANIERYFELSKATSLVLHEIEQVFGFLDDEEISL
jgi:hypothetical protein